MKPKCVLYFQIWPDPPISNSVKNLLKDSFPEYDLEIITLWNLIKANKKLVVSNLFYVLKEYGKDILLGKLKFKPAFFRTTYLFNSIRIIIGKLGEQVQDVAFTFQLQSIFDAHIEGIPHFVYTDHTHLANLQYSPFIRVNLYSAEWICCEKMIYDHADGIFTRSSNISQSLVSQYGVPETKVKCIYAGANTPLPVIDPEGKDYSAKHILFVGLDWERKGGPDLLKAFERIHKRYPDAALTVVGSRLKADPPGVVSTGPIPVEELSRYYRQATIFCMPSFNEPFGVVFVEAMAHALPLVATRIGAIPDMVVEGKNGYLVEPGDVDSLVGALDELLDDEKKRVQFGRQSWLASRERYNWQAVGKLLRLYIMDYIKEVG